MPSTFPGMDPYLEAPRFFPALHFSLTVGISNALQQQLPRAYYSEIASRSWVEYVGAVPQDETRERFIEIRTVRERHLVTTIEVLTLSSKTIGAQGRDMYIRKQREALGGKVNLVEIDLLRRGTVTTAVAGGWNLQKARPFNCHVCVHRFDEPRKFYVWPISLRQPLPKIAVPLSPDAAAVALDLQAVFDRAYDAGPYSRMNPYAGRDPEPPLLLPEDAAWATDLLRQHGLLPGG